ncbi:MAG: ethylbenzene dehydrogenase-related protein, partial [Armatimonadota bacterium]
SKKFLGIDNPRVGLLSVGAHHMERQGELADEWHWKAARTDPFAQMDDGYLNADRPSAEHEKGGRFSDEPEETGGGYRDNVVDDGGAPAFDFPPDWGGQRLLLRKSEAVPIAEEHQYETGDRVPGLVLAPLEWKRADLVAKGVWSDGKWTLEIARDRSTDDPHDVDFSDASRVYPFAVAVFNNRQFEHSYNLGVYWLRFG